MCSSGISPAFDPEHFLNINATPEAILIDAIDKPFGRRSLHVHIHAEASHVG